VPEVSVLSNSILISTSYLHHFDELIVLKIRDNSLDGSKADAE
jgi:hypothetical protein